MITASGDAFEHAQDLTDPVERRARDESLRAVFADRKSRHHESIAEAELDIDYSESPIVMGDKHEALSPGQRLPDTLKVSLASGEACLLHELTHRAGHTALVIGGPLAHGDKLARLDHSYAHERREGSEPNLIEATVVLSAGPTMRIHAHGLLPPQPTSWASARLPCWSSGRTDSRPPGRQ